jgi:NAD(P)-dependent dehydrogenase (short-subunit alcohol dehydrogenase family)
MPNVTENNTQDPRHKFTDDVASQQPSEHPGTESDLTPKADHGETSYKGFGRLKDKVALITGADSGIGRAVAIAYAREGADVVISYLNEHRDAQETARWVEEAGRRAVIIPGDIAREEHCNELVDRVIREFGRIDILVNNAAYQMEHKSLDEFTTEEWDHTFRTNIYAMFWLCKRALPKMNSGGAIINTASIQAFNPNPGLLAYAPTKAAIVNFTKAIAKFAIEKGVRANAVAPGPVWTPLIPATLQEDHVKKFGKDTTLERVAQPAEIAPLFVFAASQESSYCTGEVFGATGGKTPF